MDEIFSLFAAIYLEAEEAPNLNRKASDASKLREASIAIYLGEEAPEYRSHLEGIATDAVHLARYSNAAVIINLMVIDKLMVINPMVIDKLMVIDNDKR